MTQVSHFSLKALAAACLLVSAGQVAALEEMQENELSEATGEGIAFLPENFSLRTNGADGTLDTGYVRLIPVGPLRQDPSAPNNLPASFDKADAYIYGLSVSQSNKNVGQARDFSTSGDLASGFGRAIGSWGTVNDPWYVATRTEQNVPNFNAGTANVSYFGVNAPSFDRNKFNTPTAADAAAYNLKLGLWTDIYKRDSDVAEAAYAGLNERLRMNMIWDGMSMNGTQLRVFQTLNGAENALNGPTGSADRLPQDYNNTLGFDGLVRLNSADGQNLRATVNQNTALGTSQGYTKTYDGGDEAAVANQPTSHLYRERVEFYGATKTVTWTAPAVKSVLHLGTGQTGTNLTNDLTTPALGGAAPNFRTDEGINLYHVNVNLPIGQLYQPLMMKSDGNNLTVELARIPNNEAIWTKHYQRYQPDATETYTGLGSVGATNDTRTYTGTTCNLYSCAKADGSKATHGSISIGSTEYDATKNHLSAHKGLGSVGVSFGPLPTAPQTTTIAGRFVNNIQYQRRQSVSSFWGRRWQYLRTDGWGNNTIWNNWNGGNGPHWLNLGTYPPGAPPVAGETPTPATGTIWSGSNGGTTGRNYTLYETIPDDPRGPTGSALNNFGSGVIDGISINHMKLTTTGSR